MDTVELETGTIKDQSERMAVEVTNMPLDQRIEYIQAQLDSRDRAARLDEWVKLIEFETGPNGRVAAIRASAPAPPRPEPKPTPIYKTFCWSR